MLIRFGYYNGLDMQQELHADFGWANHLESDYMEDRGRLRIPLRWIFVR